MEELKRSENEIKICSKLNCVCRLSQKLTECQMSGLTSIWARFHQQVYVQLLHAQIPKVQNYTDDLISFWCFWDLRGQRLLVKCLSNQHLGSISTTCLGNGFYACRYQKRKMVNDLFVLFCTFWIWEHKSCTYNVCEFDT